MKKPHWYIKNENTCIKLFTLDGLKIVAWGHKNIQIGLNYHENTVGARILQNSFELVYRKYTE